MDSPKALNTVKNGTRKNKKRKIDWICVNSNCTKSNPDKVITAKPFVVSYFGAKLGIISHKNH